MMKSKFYAGFSLSDEVKSLIKDTLEDEYQVSIEELENNLKNVEYCK